MLDRLRLLFIVVLLIAGSAFMAGPVSAAFKTTVTKSKDFDQAKLTRVAVVTTECYETIDCSAVERKVYAEALRLKLDFKIVPEQKVRDVLFSLGHTEYSSELKPTLIKELELDGLIELKIPFAVKGDGFGGIESSEAKIELLLTRPGGEILLHGVGTGRPHNVVSSPERVVGNIVERILKKAFD